MPDLAVIDQQEVTFYGDELTAVKTADDARAFLRPFASSYSGALWGDGYAAALEELAASWEPSAPEILNVLNVGCGRGHEAYSVAAAVRAARAERQLKVWAQDNDLISITSAATLVFAEREVPDYYRDRQLVESGATGARLVAAVRDAIVFEFHDVLSGDDFPSLDMVVVRDTLSLYEHDAVTRLLRYYHEQLNDGGILVLGTNEEAPADMWERHVAGALPYYRKKA